nr:conotoxin precursor I2 [Conus ebraeus]DAZ85836.1 TPA_inf: conotoxin precursor I2 [Conus ebraeus]DAZ85985.1 TPA_inf: conotoxin precursor I2 [Conus ebraeus]DAZ86418.1 TPA_inf: conotoxin precursor I2 [Conus judaeus]
MMCRLTSLCCLLVIVFLNSAAGGIPCVGSGGVCSSHVWCCDSLDVCCELPGPSMCTPEGACESVGSALGRRAQYTRFFRR